MFILLFFHRSKPSDRDDGQVSFLFFLLPRERERRRPVAEKKKLVAAKVVKIKRLVRGCKSFPTSIYLQNLVSIQPRTSPPKISKLLAKFAKILLMLPAGSAGPGKPRAPSRSPSPRGHPRPGRGPRRMPWRPCAPPLGPSRSSKAASFQTAR